jgi:hypothetical protein
MASRVLRSPGQVKAAWIIGSSTILFGALEGIGRGQTSFMVMSFVLGLTFVLLFVWRTGLWTTPAGVRVRNPLSAFALKWDEIRGFRIGRHGLLRASCLIDLEDGSTRYAFAIQVSNWSIRRRNLAPPERKIVADLNALLARSKGQTPAGSDPFSAGGVRRSAPAASRPPSGE